MATSRTFQTMLNEYLANELMSEELKKRDYFINKVAKDNNWKGGTLPVPFFGGEASSVSFGALTASDDIAEDAPIRGEITDYKEIWGSMIFNHRDLMEHDGKIKESTFLRILPDRIEAFMSYFKQCISLNLLNGSVLATLTSDGLNGSCIVDRPERFRIGQKISVDDDNSAAQACYVTAIDRNTKTLTVKDARASGSAVDLTGYTTAENAVIYEVGAQASSFSGLKSSLLSAANGGSATLYGQTKTAYPFLQAINVDGSGVTSTNLLEELFDAFIDCKTYGAGNPDTAIMSYKNMGSVMKSLELYKGAFSVVPGTQKASPYGWTEIEVIGPQGKLKLVAVNEMDDTYIPFIDWSAIKLFSNGFIKKRKSPEGLEFYETRATTGYTYIVDICFYGDLVLLKPSNCGILHSISY